MLMLGSELLEEEDAIVMSDNTDTDTQCPADVNNSSVDIDLIGVDNTVVNSSDNAHGMLRRPHSKHEILKM